MILQDLQFVKNEILIADASLKDLNVLLHGIKAEVDVWLISPGEDAISQIIKAIATPGLKTLHLLAHGAPGQITLGGQALTATDFRSRFDGAGERDLDIAFWSCNTGLGDSGNHFVQAVAETTGARVIASQGLVGNAAKGGSWSLTGMFPPFSIDAQKTFSDVLAIVTETAANLSNGIGWKAGDGLIINNGGGNNKATIAQLNLIRTGAKTTGAPGYVVAATVTDLSVNANDLNLLDAITLGNVVATAANTLTGTAAQIAVAISATTIDTSTRVATTLAAGSAAASDLIIIDANTTTAIGATAVSLLTGNAAQLAKVISATTIDTAGNVRVTLDAGPATAADLSTIDANTSAVVNALAVTTISGTATQIVTALNSAGISKSGSIGVTINAGKAAAADLSAIDAKTTAIEDATAVTVISGTAAQVKTVLASAGISLSPAVSVTLSGNVSVADLNRIDAKTTGVITATVLEHSISSLLTLTGTDNAYTISVTTPTTVNAADLNALDAKTTLNVVATAVTTLTGLATDIATAISSPTINTATNVAVTVAAGDASAADLNLIDANTTKVVGALAVTTLTGSAADIAVAISATTINTAANVGVTVDEVSASAAYLLLIQANTSAVIDATAVNEITGSVLDIEEVISSVNFTFTDGFAVKVNVTDPVTVADVNTIASHTSGVITAIVSEGDIATLLTITPNLNALGPNNLSFTITDLSVVAANLLTLAAETTVKIDAAAVATLTGTAEDIAVVVSSGLVNYAGTVAIVTDVGSADAANLNVIDASITTIIDATALTEITGVLTDIQTAIASTEITFTPGFAITVADFDLVTVANLSSLATLTPGIITAYVSDTDIATLLTFVPNPASSVPNNLSFSITDLTVGAANLLTLASKTAVPIDATGVSEFTGSAADLASALSSGVINYLIYLNVIVDAGSANAADLNTIDSYIFLSPVNAKAVTTITGLLVDIETVFSGGIYLSSSYDINVTDTGDLGILSAFATTSGSLILGNSSNNAITLDLGVSGLATIILQGSGDDIITASASVNETFVLGAAQDGGTTINGLTVGDTVNIDGADAIDALAGISLATGADVVSAGEWSFVIATQELTYFNTAANAGAGSAETITLTGVTDVSLLAGGDAFAIA